MLLISFPDMNNIAGGLLAVRRPRLHQLAPLLERVAAAVGLLGLIADHMRQRRLHDLARCAGDEAADLAAK